MEVITKTKEKKRKYSHNNPELKSVDDVNTMGFGETKDTKGCEGRDRQKIFKSLKIFF